jgi:hypothetical protein
MGKPAVTSSRQGDDHPRCEIASGKNRHHAATLLCRSSAEFMNRAAELGLRRPDARPDYPPMPGKTGSIKCPSGKNAQMVPATPAASNQQNANPRRPSGWASMLSTFAMVTPLGERGHCPCEGLGAWGVREQRRPFDDSITDQAALFRDQTA